MVFYRKYRPQRFRDLVGQEAIRETLLAQLASGKISHGYLFAGPRGTGKTSCARILAKAVNCEVYGSPLTVHGKKKSVNRQQSTVNRFGEPCGKCTSCLAVSNGSHLDLVEIDAASNRGIDEIRDLREKIKLVPVSGRFKVYVIDEAHMLTMEAFNALLKTLEEPPGHAIFILCTTNPGKLPATIISRLARLNFLKANNNNLAVSVNHVARQEAVKIDQDAVKMIVLAADGSYRDALTLLEQLAATGKKITKDHAEKMLILGDLESVVNFIEALISADLKAAIVIIERLDNQHTDLSSFTREVVAGLEGMLLLKIGAGEQVDAPDQQVDNLVQLSEGISLAELEKLLRLAAVAEGEMKTYPSAKIPLILASCRYCLAADKTSSGRLMPSLVANDQLLVQHPKSGKKPKQTIEKNTKFSKPHKAAKGAALSLAAIEDRWSEFLDHVRPVNAHLVALLRATRPTKIEGEELTLEVFYRFHKEKLEEPKIMKILLEQLAAVMKVPIGLKLVLARSETKPPRVVRESNVVDLVGEDLAKIAGEVFSER